MINVFLQLVDLHVQFSVSFLVYTVQVVALLFLRFRIDRQTCNYFPIIVDQQDHILALRTKSVEAEERHANYTYEG